MAMPITREQTHKAARWLKKNFGQKMATACAGTPFSTDLICAIMCQETAYAWLGWIDTWGAAFVCERCVLDASGDAPDTSRNPFPKNTAAFRAKYGDGFTDMLIEEANRTRKIRGMGPKRWVYKGYGIFQYDLQHVDVNEKFFRERQWYDFDICLARALGELKSKYKIEPDLWQAVRRYNGSGPKAVQYANNVFRFVEWCSEVPG